MRKKQLYLTNFLNSIKDLNNFGESNSRNDSKTIFIKTETEEVPSVLLSSPTTNLSSECHLDVHSLEEEATSEPSPDVSESDNIIQNAINSASENEQIVDPSEIFPFYANRRRIVELYFKNPSFGRGKIAQLVGVARTTVDRTIRRYKLKQNEIISASVNRQTDDPSIIFPGNANRQRIVDLYLKNPAFLPGKIAKLVGVARTTVDRTINKYKHLVLNNKKTQEDCEYCVCQICGKLLKSQQSYSAHIKIVHKKNKSQQCDICGRECFNKAILRSHMQVHVPNEFKIKNFQCDHCEKSFDNKNYIKRHLFAHHTKFKSYSCYLCGKNFYSQTTLKTHHASHSEKMFQCDYPDCEKMFKHKKSMALHRNVHSKELRFECPYDSCDNFYVGKRNLNLHIFTWHKKIKEKCPVGNGCKFASGRKYHMKVHLKKHSELSVEELEKYNKQLSFMNLC
ncbi:CLUMA_CG018731, isoform A [Clunio marinus]|uniref:CLUMA_CG018731, isoform A n=1 Tax=Clunio marinus TaxID=568069 RepID=A0A1J1IZJ6_9DIPT|nr:CLUMA_CG018731, isoform A [Clunio marinus]